jgi:hypothetical protein
VRNATRHPEGQRAHESRLLRPTQLRSTHVDEGQHRRCAPAACGAPAVSTLTHCTAHSHSRTASAQPERNSERSISHLAPSRRDSLVPAPRGCACGWCARGSSVLLRARDWAVPLLAAACRRARPHCAPPPKVGAPDARHGAAPGVGRRGQPQAQGSAAARCRALRPARSRHRRTPSSRASHAAMLRLLLLAVLAVTAHGCGGVAAGAVPQLDHSIAATACRNRSTRIRRAALCTARPHTLNYPLLPFDAGGRCWRAA